MQIQIQYILIINSAHFSKICLKFYISSIISKYNYYIILNHTCFLWFFWGNFGGGGLGGGFFFAFTGWSHCNDNGLFGKARFEKGSLLIYIKTEYHVLHFNQYLQMCHKKISNHYYLSNYFILEHHLCVNETYHNITPERVQNYNNVEFIWLLVAHWDLNAIEFEFTWVFVKKSIAKTNYENAAKNENSREVTRDFAKKLYV